jgi:hypothetical protein
MRNKTITAPAANTQNRKQSLTVAFQKFNGVFLAKISNNDGKETFAYGPNKSRAEHNALSNYRLKYLTRSINM